MEDGFDGFLLSPAQMAGLHVRGRLSWRTAVRRQNGLKGQVRPDPNASARSRGTIRGSVGPTSANGLAQTNSSFLCSRAHCTKYGLMRF